MISVSHILRRTSRIYVEKHALAPLAAALIAVFVALARTASGHSVALAVVALLLALALIGLFVGVIVILVADAVDGRPRRSVRELLRGAWSALARLLLVGMVGIVTITFVSSIAPLLVLAVLATAVVNGAGYVLILPRDTETALARQLAYQRPATDGGLGASDPLFRCSRF